MRTRPFLILAASFATAVGASSFACSSHPSVDDESGGAGAVASSTAASTASNASSTADASSTIASSSSGMGCMGLADACSQCAFQSCQSVYCACYAEPACGSLIACAQKCSPNDMQCAQTCLTQNEAGISDAFLVDDCAASSCGG